MSTDGKAKIADVNRVMMGVKNELSMRAITRKDDELEQAYAALDHAHGFIGELADDGIVDMTCESCDDEQEEVNNNK